MGLPLQKGENAMLKKIFSIFIAIITFFISLFGSSGSGGGKPEKVNAYKNLSYGSAKIQKLDLYIPKKADGKYALILNLHGGKWTNGDKSEFGEDELKKMCSDFNCAAATMNYRFVNASVDAHDILDDIDAALKTIKAKASENGVVIDRVMLNGVSAGGHLALLYACSKGISAAVKIAAVAVKSAPTDLSDERLYSDSSSFGSRDEVYSLISKVCGKSFNKKTFSRAVPTLKTVSPITYVSKSCPPVLIAHGKNDETVPYSNALMFSAALSGVGVKNDLITYSNSGHDLSNNADCEKKFNDLFASYAKTYLK